MVILKILFWLLGVGAALWLLSMAVYFFNLDMKLTAFLYPLLEKHYDHIKRDKHL